MYSAQFLANRIKQLAKEKNTLVRDLLESCDLSINTISQMTDKKGVSSFSLAKIADYLDCSVDYLLGRTNDDTPMSFHSKWEDDFRQRLDYLLGTYDSSDIQDAGIDTVYYDAILSGNMPLTLNAACNIADELGVSLDFLFGRTDEIDINC